MFQAPQPAAAPVTKEIDPLQRRIASAKINSPTGNGTALGMSVLSHRKGQTPRIAAGCPKAQASFHNVPPIVCSTWRTCRLEVDFFESGLTNIGDEVISGVAIK